jgi:hypothetical protein
LLELEHPVILETHGGTGKLYARCYGSVPEGVVFEKNPAKSGVLAKQRPAWAVYEADCVRAMAAGVGSHLPVNFVDFDPYGGPWVGMDAFFEGLKPSVPKLVLVVHDGLRERLTMHVAWITEGLQDVVDRMGNAAIYENYLDVCKGLVKEKAAKAGYSLRRWTGYYGRPTERPAGVKGELSGWNATHYAAVLERAA